MIGKFRHRIAIQQPTITHSATGAEILTWSTLYSVYADIRTINAQEQVIAAQMEMATMLHTVTIRYRSGITPKMRVEWGSRYFSIEGVPEPDNRQRWLNLSCRELVGDAEVA